MKSVRTVNVGIIYDQLIRALTAGVNEVAEVAEEQAIKDAPIRKVFRYGRTPRSGLRIQGRQETRTLSASEGNAEASIRRKLGLPSAFPTKSVNGIDTGERVRGSSPDLRTALFPGNYRSRDRANDYRSMSRRTAGFTQGGMHLVDIHQTYVKAASGKLEPVSTPVPNARNESDLSARGLYELKRRKGGAAFSGKGDDKTLGGGLRKSITLLRAEPGGRRIKAIISAGDEEVDYAKYVEFGTRRSRAQPFLRPALATARENLMPTLLLHLNNLGRR